MGSTVNYWNVPNSSVLALGNSTSGTNNVTTNGLGTNAKTLLAAEVSGTYGTRIFSITVNCQWTGAGAEALLLFDAAGSSTAPLYYEIPFQDRAVILFDDGKLPVAGAIHLPKLIIPTNGILAAAHTNNTTNLWVYTQGGDGG